jgi:DKNYY family
MLKSIINFFKGTAFFFKLIFKFFKFVLMLTGLMSFPRCNSGGYTKEGNKSFYNGKEIGKDFKVLNDVFAKDDSTAYFKTYAISGADVATFTALSKHYAKDKNAVYFCDEEREGQNYYLTKHSIIIVLKQADSASITLLGNDYSGYAKDNQRGYCNGIGFDVRDVATLDILKGRFLKDKFQVYFNQLPIKGSDAASFRLLNDYYAQDKNNVYIFDNLINDAEDNEAYTDKSDHFVVLPCDHASFAVLDYPYSKDANSVYYINKKMPDADVPTFSMLENRYSKDKQSAYFEGKKVSGAEAATFVVMPETNGSLDETFYAHDKTNVFIKDTKIVGADVLTFTVLGLDYAMDNKVVYYKTKIVKGADPHSFKIYRDGYGDEDAEDAKNKYSKGVKVSK